ncbi:SNF2 family N-terminal domain-containing protein [Hypoxylon sp. NC0597]|nr:SNF2 family N-terminal domain-containing protein [Hypoxylon sp. NC0597]
MTEEMSSTHPPGDSQGAMQHAGKEVTKKTASKKAPRPGVCKSDFWRKLIRRNLKQIQDEHTIHGRLDPHGIFKTQRRLNDFYSNHSISPHRIIDNQNFARWAIEEALREYLPDTQFQVTGEIMQGQSVTIPKDIAEAIRADGQQEVDSEDPNGAKEIEAEIVQEVGSMAEAIISASPNSLGPPIEACSSYLRMEKCGEYGRNKLPIWRSPLFPRLDGEGGRRGFLDNQITAIVWIMSRFIGVLPRLKIKQTQRWDPHTEKYVQEPETPLEKMHRMKLRGPRYAGAILADSMGLGKTMTTIACLDILANQRLNAQIENGKQKYRPMLILTPNNTVAAQWVDEIEHITSKRGVKRIIISGNGVRKKPHQERVRCLTSREFTKDWPQSLNYVWNEDDLAASRVIFVVAIDTWARRTCMSTGDDKDTEKEWYSTFTKKGRKFSIVVVDEAYKIRHAATRNWKSVALLDRQFTLLVTATPCMNQLTDLLGPIRLLWQGPEKLSAKQPKKWEEVEKTFERYSDLRQLDNLPSWDDRQLFAGRPGLITQMIYKYRGSSSVDIQHTRKFLKYFESLGILRRAPSSQIFEDWARTKPVSLDGLLPRVDNFTVNIQPDHALAKAYQNAHIDLLIHYMATVKKWSRKKGDESKLKPVLSIHRQFQMAAASMDVYRLDELFSLNKFGTKVEHISIMRRAGVNFMHLAPFLLEPQDPEPRVALDYVKLAVRKSPVLRYILHYMKENVLNGGQNGKIKKLLITEASPILAYYYELVLQFLLVHCRTLHSGLTPDERRDLISSFNDDKDHSCQVMIQMYTVGFAGSNLHKNCSQVIVASQAHSLAIQWQAVHRVIRVGQESDVKVYRLKVNNSFHSFCESRQTEKILPELGTRAQGPMNSVLVQLLNLFQCEIDEVWETKEAEKLLENMNLLADPTMYEEDEELESDTDGSQSDEPPPKRIKIEEGAFPKTEAADQDAPDSMEGIAEYPSQEFTQTCAQECETDSEDSEKESGSEPGESSGKGILGKRRGKHVEMAPPKSTAYLFDGGSREFLSLKPRAEYYDEFKGLPREVKSYFCHKKNNLRRMLSFGNLDNNNATTRVWTADDLNDSAVLERAMELTLRVRLGTNNLEMLPLPQIDFSLAPKKKVKELAGLLGDLKVTDQDVEAARENSQGTSSKLKSDSSRALKSVSEDMSASEMDQVYKDEIRTRDIDSHPRGAGRKTRAKKISRSADDDCLENPWKDEGVSREGARASDFATDDDDRDTRSRLKSEPRDVKVKTEESDTLTLGNIKKASKTESDDGEPRVKQESSDEGVVHSTGDNSTVPRVKEESPSRSMAETAHDGFTDARTKSESETGDTNDHSNDDAHSQRVKEESTTGEVIDLTDDTIETPHEPIVIDDSDDENMDDNDIDVDSGHDNDDDDSIGHAPSVSGQSSAQSP